MLAYVGIDPSLTGTGICVLRDGEFDNPVLKTICTSPETHRTIYDRVDSICYLVKKTIADNCTSAVIYIERPYVDTQHKETTEKIYGLAFSLRRELYHAELSFTEVPPSTLKQFVCNSGNAQKQVIMDWVADSWGIRTKDNNQADAAALARMAHAGTLWKRYGAADGYAVWQMRHIERFLAGGKEKKLRMRWKPKGARTSRTGNLWE